MSKWKVTVVTKDGKRTFEVEAPTCEEAWEKAQKEVARDESVTWVDEK